ncbi:magnesium transporter CorA family protein [Mycolicibacterium tokaiense]|uniref:Mg2 transporter protein CorA family protein n=1 Tax=Mycolicibacterium tokaiense TaxID=39695 RepID=A0A378TJJ1_9MYCO|nr:magnesium transporter CorA family protein [Mycolicibacterium tokaiense]BBY85494.1 magnesium transporter [Mycolicibacterium tokaiense]STZ59995.1 Mg2 transporter protein CorA family protein [Mycolicibacterium tokaiense]
MTPPGCELQGRVWKAGKPQQEFEFDRISDYLTEPDTLVWVDMFDPDHDALAALAQELGLNVWAVEDAVAPSERVKATVYPSHTFFTVYAVTMETPTDEPKALLTKHRISAFVLKNALVTVRLAPQWDIHEVLRRWDDLGGQQYGVSALVHGLLDVVVDGHFDAVQVLDDGIEDLEDTLFDPPKRDANIQRRSFALRKDLVNLRRVVLPMREVVNTIQHHRAETHRAPELDPLYTDLYDHVLRATEWTESLRDMITTVFETNLSLQDARLNTVMKKLTGWAAIIAVPTAITGFYGQNVPYPGFDSWSGFVASSALIVFLVVVLYVAFRRRDWL